jgi:hypothetical protein
MRNWGFTMSTIEYKTEQEIQKIGIDILYKGLGRLILFALCSSLIRVMETMLKTVNNGKKTIL